MRILICNDDGYFAPGIIALAKTMQKFGDVMVVAPEHNRSGASSCLTLSHPLSLELSQTGETKGFYYLNGTPVDCMHVALTSGIFDGLPDLVLSGINRGQNLGTDTLYSGTVAAAIEAHHFEIPALAFSLADYQWAHLDDACRMVEKIVQQLLDKGLEAHTLLNINLPAVPFDAVQGVEVTRLGKRRITNAVQPIQTPWQKTAYWIGAVGEVLDGSPGTDFHAIEQGRISITPLQVDLTCVRQRDEYHAWAQTLGVSLT